MDQTLDLLVNFVATTTYEHLPAEVVDQSRNILVDTFGCAIGGRGCITAQVAQTLPWAPVRGEIGAVIGSTMAVTVDTAAFWNTGMIRYLDFNDTARGGHPSDMIGALVAMSRVAQSSGPDVLTSIVVAYEIFTRLTDLLQTRRNLTIDQGYAAAIGATGGLCYLLRLSQEETRHALAIAATQGVPLRASRAGQLSHYKGAATAVSSRDAVFSVYLARAGMTGPSSPFDGRHGIMELLDGRESPAELPEFNEWRIMGTWLKYWPVAYNTQISIWAALELRRRVDISKIEQATLYTSKFLKHESGSELEKWDPQTRETADHSLPYIFARAAWDGTISPNSFGSDMIHDPRVRDLMSRIRVDADESIDAQWPDRIALRVEAVDATQRTHVVEVEHPRGHERNPMTAEDISSKFMSLTEPALGSTSASNALELAWNVRDLRSFQSVVEAFVTQPPSV